jgi:hypothetical protein
VNRPTVCPLCKGGPATFYPPYDPKSGSPITKVEGWECPTEGGRFEISFDALKRLEATPTAAPEIRKLIRDERAGGRKIPLIDFVAGSWVALRRDGA